MPSSFAIISTGCRSDWVTFRISGHGLPSSFKDQPQKKTEYSSDLSYENDALAEKEAEAIIDRFVADESSADLLRLQQSIADALRAAYQKGKEANND